MAENTENVKVITDKDAIIKMLNEQIFTMENKQMDMRAEIIEDLYRRDFEEHRGNVYYMRADKELDKIYSLIDKLKEYIPYSDDIAGEVQNLEIEIEDGIIDYGEKMGLYAYHLGGCCAYENKHIAFHCF